MTLRRVVIGLGLAASSVALLWPAAAWADGPGYGGTADALTADWQPAPEGEEGLLVHGSGFRGGSAVSVQFGTSPERSVAADDQGVVEVRVGPGSASAAATRVSVQPGSSIALSGHDPAGSPRLLVGAVPPQSSGVGASAIVPSGVAVALAGTIGLGLRRRIAFDRPAGSGRHRHRARHRPPGSRPGRRRRQRSAAR